MVRGMKNLVLILAFLGLVACGDDSANDGSASNNGDPDVARDAGDDVGQDTDAPEADTPEGDVPADTPDPELPPMPWSVDEPGHYAVGYTTGELTYQAEGIGERTLRMSYWYPTFDEVGGGQYQIYARPEVHQDAIPAFTQPLPVLIFSHGSTSFAEQSFFMTEYFASHGFIVAAPDHTGNLYTDRAIPPETFEFRPLDIIAVLDDSGDAVPFEIHDCYGSHVLGLRPTEGWTADSVHTVTVGPGLSTWDGLDFTTFEFVFDTTPAPVQPAETGDTGDTGASRDCGCAGSGRHATGLPLTLLGLGLLARRRRHPAGVRDT